LSSEPPSDETPLSLVHRGWDHLRLQRPLAAWACWMRALRRAPGDPAATEALAILAAADELPPQARKEWAFRSASSDARRAKWSSAFAGRNLADPDRAAEAFEAIAQKDPDDSAALFNLALCLAWSGRNTEAVAILDRSVALAAPVHFDAAVASWTLAEILRHGAGAEPLADDVSANLQIDWPEFQGDALEALAPFAAIWLVPMPLHPVTGEPVSTTTRLAEWFEDTDGMRPPRVLVEIAVEPGSVRFSSPDLPSLEAAEAIASEHLGDLFRPTRRWSVPLPLRFLDAAAWLVRIPSGEDDPSVRRSAIEHYYENLWVTRPRLGLADADGLPRSPAEAAHSASGGDLATKAKLATIVLVREGLAARPRMVAMAAGYPFDRLRRRLGLPLEDETAVDPSDVTCMARHDLEQLKLLDLSAEVLVEAHLASLSVCEDSTISRFADEIARREGAITP